MHSDQFMVWDENTQTKNQKNVFFSSITLIEIPYIGFSLSPLINKHWPLTIVVIMYLLELIGT